MNRVNEGGWLLVVDFMRLMIAIFIESDTLGAHITLNWFANELQ